MLFAEMRSGCGQVGQVRCWNFSVSTHAFNSTSQGASDGLGQMCLSILTKEQIRAQKLKFL